MGAQGLVEWCAQHVLESAGDAFVVQGQVGGEFEEQAGAGAPSEREVDAVVGAQVGDEFVQE